MRYVVGYVPNRRGHDAVNLAATLAETRGASLDVVVVLPVETRTYDRYVPDRAYHAHLEAQGHEWLDQALARVPENVDATRQIRRADSITEGLIDAATDAGEGSQAALIVMGASHRGLRGRFTVGSVASALLHSSPVPVALAPAGYEAHPAVTRITCATGTRQGADALLDVAIDSAAGRHVPLRLMSLVALDSPDLEESDANLEATQRHISTLTQKAHGVLAEECVVAPVVGQGRTTEEAIRALTFDPGEVVLVGSSRLAGPGSLFLGTSANRMLRELPVPMIIVPRDYQVPEEAKAGVG